MFTALCNEKYDSKILRSEIKDKLLKKGIQVQTPMEMKAKKTIFLRRLDRHVGQHSSQEIEEDIRRCNNWAKEVIVNKIKDYTHVLKLEFETLKKQIRH